MISIFKRDCKRLFAGLFGWVMLAAMLLAASLAVTFSTFLSLSSDFASAFSSLSLSLILFAPILAAYSFTAERAKCRDLWLKSLPVRRSGLVLGKYAAALMLFLLQALFLAILPPILSNFGEISYGTAYMALLAYFLLAAALLAICCAVAAGLRNRWISMGLNVLLCTAFYFLPLLAALCEAISWLALVVILVICLLVGALIFFLRDKRLRTPVVTASAMAFFALLLAIPRAYSLILAVLFDKLSLFQRANGFTGGHLDLPALILFLSVVVLFLLLTVWGQDRPRMSAASALALGCAVLLIGLNVAAGFLPFRARYSDVSGSKTYRISDTARRYLTSLQEDIEIIYYSYGGKDHADKDLYPFVLQYADASPRITVRLVDPDKTGEAVADQSILIRSAKRSKALLASELFYYYNSSTYMVHTLTEYAQILNSISEMTDEAQREQMTSAYAPGTTTAYFTGDVNVIGAIANVTAAEAPAVYAFGNGNSEAINQFLRQELENSAFTVKTLTKMDTIPADTQVLMLSLSKDLTEAQANALSAYLSSGGTLFLSTVYTTPSMPRLKAVLSAYGLSSPDNRNQLYDTATQSTMYYATEATTHPVNDLFDGKFVAAYAHAIELTETAGVTQTVLLQTPNTGVCIKEGDTSVDTSNTSSIPLCVLAEKGDSRVVWLSMPLDSYIHGLSDGNDGDFVNGVLQWMTDSGIPAVEIADAALPSTLLAVTDRVFVIWLIIGTVLPPILLVVGGYVRRYIRRKK